MLRICVTGGGTVAPIDDVRRVANFSTGRFSAALTEASLRRGHEVWHLRTPSAAAPFERFAAMNLDADPPEAEFARLSRLRDEYRSVRDRFHATTLTEGTVPEYADALREILETASIDVVFHAAALSDYAPERTRGKLRSSEGSLTIRCEPTPKVIRSVKTWAPRVFLVGFKLLSDVPREELIAAAAAACRTNRADVTVANDFRTVSAGRQTLHLVRPGREVVTLEPSDDLADRLVERIVTWRGERSSTPAESVVA